MTPSAQGTSLLRTVFPLWLCALLALAFGPLAQPARAADPADLPPNVRIAVPDELWQAFPPELLDCLSLGDLVEYAEAYTLGEYRTVAAIEVEETGGPLCVEDALWLLELYEGGPFAECRFIRLAKHYYGDGTFSSLRWKIDDRGDGTVGLTLRFASAKERGFKPEALYNGIAGVLAGVRYEDKCYGGKDRTLAAGVQLAEDDLEEPKAYVEWSDRTPRGGRDQLNLLAEAANDWRERLPDTDAYAQLRVRMARLSGEYVWGEALDLGPLTGDVSLGGGAYTQDIYIYTGDPTAGGTAPRSDFDQEQAAGFVSLGWQSEQVDRESDACDGYRLSAKAEQHGGGFDYSRLALDYRRYWPAPNILGIRSGSPASADCFDDVRWHFPPASLALQLQAVASDGDVPYGGELAFGGPAFCRGYSKSRHIGTKLLGARLEYRFAYCDNRDHELFVFCDNVLGGETFDDLETLNAVGVGGVFKLRFLGGIRAGAYFGGAVDGSETQAALAFGYMF